jgi:anti-sigma regulatory factor (Ser/Thr protein kinase)
MRGYRRFDAAFGSPARDTLRPMLEVDPPHTVQAPGIARRSLADWLAPAVDSDELGAARLLVSELVTNAVVHGHGDIRLRATLDDDRLLVEVIDEGEGFEQTICQPISDAEAAAAPPAGGGETRHRPFFSENASPRHSSIVNI